jgi:hypothetical protein
MKWNKLVAVTAMALFCWATAQTASAEDKPNQYIGAKKCGKCHKKELIGDQYGQWQEGSHSQTFDILLTEDALAIAKERGMTEAPSESADCLKCHATAFGLTADQFKKDPLELKDGVQCESCHGPGSNYKKKSTMSDHDKAVAAGMWEPGEDEKICTTCHNDESPTWDAEKGFDFKQRKEDIAHPIPEDVKGRYVEAVKEAKAAKAGGDE